MSVSETDDPIILSPGPVATAPEVKRAMLRDMTPNQPELLELTAFIRRRLVELANGGDDYVCVPVQGVGNTANEAVLGSLVRRERTLLVVNNGFYGARLKEIATAIGLAVKSLDLPITLPVDPADVAAALAADPAIGHVVICQVDTGTGLMNPVDAIAGVVRGRGVGLIVDAIASFGGLPLDAGTLDAEAIVLSPNKWLEGLPGLGLTIVQRSALETAAGRSHSYVLDLHRQWQSFERGFWRFTPPVQSIAALAAALRIYETEGRAARFARIEANWRTLVDGLRAQGFETLIEDEVAAPVIATFHEPADRNYSREAFFTAMRGHGFTIFRGCLTDAPTFRIGCMGAFGPATMARVVEAVRRSMAAMGVADGSPRRGVEAAE